MKKNKKELLSVAIALTATLYDGKFDKAGEPYVLHCLEVMRGIHSNDEELQCAAVLHDVVEDKLMSLMDLRAYGFTERTLFTVNVLSHQKDAEDYFQYIERVSNSKDARIIKLSDLKHNSNITRLRGISKKDLERMEKYHKAYTFLKSFND